MYGMRHIMPSMVWASGLRGRLTTTESVPRSSLRQLGERVMDACALEYLRTQSKRWHLGEVDEAHTFGGELCLIAQLNQPLPLPKNSASTHEQHCKEAWDANDVGHDAVDAHG
eukprot:scaffold181576_cov39-Prasinocladus_malaysianus.AAC.1